MLIRALKHVLVLPLVVGTFTSLLASDTIVPSVNAELGPCTVDFTVTDRIHKPIYGAIIQTRFKYGIWGFRSMNLVVYTNSDGRARVEGLPAVLRRPPLYFTITYRNLEQTWYWTGLRCHETATVVLNTQ